MRRPALNFLVDAAAFVGFVFLVSTGVLMRYVLPPGSGKRTVVWGLDRHEWGTFHFWMAVVFLAVLASHLVLHRKWIVSVLRGRPRSGEGGRVALGLVGLLAVLALAAAPFVSPVQQVESGGGGPGGAGGGGEERALVRGSMTLGDVERATGVPAAYVLGRLGLPADVPRDEPLGGLSRRYGFHVDDVRRIVAGYGGDG